MTLAFVVPGLDEAASEKAIAILQNRLSQEQEPDVYLEVQHPCWSCNSNSSSANASAGVR